MLFKNKIFAGIIIFLLSLNMCRQNKRDFDLLSFMIYGNDFIASVVLPNRWTMDITSSQESNVDGHFYLKGYDITNSPAILVFNEFNDTNAEIGFEERVDEDINYFSEFYSCSILDWNIKNNKNYKIIIYSLKNDNESLMYSANIKVEEKYFVNLWITIIYENKYDEIIKDFIRCLENSEFTKIE